MSLRRFEHPKHGSLGFLPRKRAARHRGIVHLLKFVLELQACLNNEKNVSNKMQCIPREIKLQQTLDKNNCRTDARLNRSRELIESGKKILENGVVGLKDCIYYISKALAIMV
nr:60S ribosomal protein L3-2-like [Tanacetum cinerariifolium]